MRLRFRSGQRKARDVMAQKGTDEQPESREGDSASHIGRRPRKIKGARIGGLPALLRIFLPFSPVYPSLISFTLRCTGPMKLSHLIKRPPWKIGFLRAARTAGRNQNTTPSMRSGSFEVPRQGACYLGSKWAPASHAEWRSRGRSDVVRACREDNGILFGASRLEFNRVFALSLAFLLSLSFFYFAARTRYVISKRRLPRMR